MKGKIILLLILVCSLQIGAQEGHKLNTGIDMSYGPHYFGSDRNNPLAGGISIGYEYDFIFFFGIEAGFRFGGYNQSVRYGENAEIKDIYRGTYWAPYIAPKLYLPIGYDEKKDRPRFVYIENRLSYGRMNINLDKINGMEGSAHKYELQYEFRMGYQFPISQRWAMNCWLGYNTFDFSRVKPETIKFKNSTPIQIGIGFNYIIKQ